jgi:hypothetical protein
MEKLIRRILKEIREENPHHQLKKFLEDRIDFEGYNLDKNPRNKISQLYDVFEDEYGWAIKRMGERKALIEWLQGLPSTIDIPYYYDEISNLLYALGFDEVKEMEDDEVSDFYYDLIAKTILKNK